MVLKIPKLIQGLLNGTPQMGASDAMGMARQGAHMAANAISGGATTALKAAGAVAGAYAAAGGGGLADAVGGGGGKMSSISNIGGGGSDATGMGAISGLSGGGGGGGAAAMAANMSGGSGGGAASAPSSGGGSMPSSGGGGATDVPADTGSKGGGGQSVFGKLGQAVMSAGKNAAISAAQKNGLVKAFQQGHQIGSNPYGLSDADRNAGGVSRSFATGEVLNAAGNKVDYNPQIDYPDIKPSSVANPPPKLPQFDPNNFQV